MKVSFFCKTSRFCVALVAIVACVFYSLMLVAQVCVTRPHLAWCAYYAAVVLLVSYAANVFGSNKEITYSQFTSDLKDGKIILPAASWNVIRLAK